LTTVTEAPTSDLGPHSTREDELDQELLDLPDPPKRERTLTIAMLLFTAAASIAMIFALRRDAAYAFAAAAPAEIGDLTAAPADALAENRFVRGQGALGAAHAIRYERPLVSESFRLMPVSGRDNVWVEVRVPPGGENVRWVPPKEVAGRLVRFASAGPKHRGLAAAVHDATGQVVPSDAWLLVEGDAPSGSRWAVLLEVMFAAFAIWNLLVSAKLLRRVS
jgi:hypothetical protein